MRNSFPLFQSHLDLAHSYWSRMICIGDTVIDATCGNGRDTLTLCRLALSEDRGQLYAFDIQTQAIHSTRHFLESHLPLHIRKRVILEQRCHSIFPDCLAPESVNAIIYNLGYLPGGNKTKTTEFGTTLQSLQQAQVLLKPGGLISVTCYPGHPEGAREQEAVLTHASHLPPQEWSCCHHIWHNRQQAPSLLLIQRRK